MCVDKSFYPTFLIIKQKQRCNCKTHTIVDEFRQWHSCPSVVFKIQSVNNTIKQVGAQLCQAQVLLGLPAESFSFQRSLISQPTQGWPGLMNLISPPCSRLGPILPNLLILHNDSFHNFYGLVCLTTIVETALQFTKTLKYRQIDRQN